MNAIEAAEALLAHSERLLFALRTGQIEQAVDGIAERERHIAALGAALREDGLPLPETMTQALQRQEAQLHAAAVDARASIGKALADLRRGRALSQSYQARPVRDARFIDHTG